MECQSKIALHSAEKTVCSDMVSKEARVQWKVTQTGGDRALYGGQSEDSTAPRSAAASAPPPHAMSIAGTAVSY